MNPATPVNQATEPTVLNGILASVLYRHEGSTWSLLQVHTEEESFVASGYFEMPIVGEELVLTGSWTRHKNPGREFEVVRSRAKPPADITALPLYISNASNVPLSVAEEIVRYFGEDTVSVLTMAPDRLGEMNNIESSYLSQVRESWGNQRRSDYIKEAMERCGIKPDHYAVLAARLPGADIEQTLKDDPYLIYLYCEVDLQAVHAFAKALGVADKEKFIKACFLRHLRNRSAFGESVFPIEEIATRTGQVLQMDLHAYSKSIVDALKYLKSAGLIVTRGDTVQLASTHKHEISLAQHLERLRAGEASLQCQMSEKRVRKILSQSLRKYEMMTVADVTHEIAKHKFCLVDCPSTIQMTSLSMALTKLFLSLRGDVVCLGPSPTLSRWPRVEAQYQNYMSVGDFLGLKPVGPPSLNSETVCDIDVVIVHHAHVLGVPELDQLFASLPDTATVILIGNTRALPSVYTGQPFRDLCEFYEDEVIDLAIRQFPASPYPIENVQRMLAKKRQLPYLKDIDFQNGIVFVPSDPEEIESLVVAAAVGDVPQILGVEPLKDTLVMVPDQFADTFQGPRATEIVGNWVRSHKFAADTSVRVGERIFYTGEPVFFRKPWFSPYVSAYELGRIEKLMADSMEISFGSRRVQLSYKEANDLQPASCLTVSRAFQTQVSLAVLVVLPGQRPTLSMDLMMTALSVSRRWLIVVGDVKNIHTGLSDTSYTNSSGLMEVLSSDH